MAPCMVEEGGFSPEKDDNGEGGGAAGVAASRGGASSPVDSGDFGEFHKHEEREEWVRN
jgi:hypothetical protein